MSIEGESSAGKARQPAPAAFADELENHGRLSRASREFVEHAVATPELQDRASYAPLDDPARMSEYMLQAWPTLESRRLVEEAARASAALAELIRSIPGRVFRSQPLPLARFYGLDLEEAQVLAEVLGNRDSFPAGASRGDFVWDAQEFRLVEMNMSSNLGGWKGAIWGELYRKVPLLRGFLSGDRDRPRSRDTLRIFFEHVLREATGRLELERELNVGLVVSDDHPGADDRAAVGERALRAVLAAQAPSLRGFLTRCSYRDLDATADGAHHRGRRLHVLVNHQEDETPTPIYRCWLRGRVLMFNGPVTHLWGNKANLAVLSELQDTALFTSEERDLIRRHVVWTREVRPGSIEFRGRTLPLSELLRCQRENLVLKPTLGKGGEGVLVGLSTRREAWEAAVARAFDQPGWIVQEWIESAALLYQTPSQGFDSHDVVWGFLNFGDRYGGCLVRTAPRTGDRVVNGARGASEGMVFEVDD